MAAAVSSRAGRGMRVGRLRAKAELVGQLTGEQIAGGGPAIGVLVPHARLRRALLVRPR